MNQRVHRRWHEYPINSVKERLYEVFNTVIVIWNFALKDWEYYGSGTFFIRIISIKTDDIHNIVV